MKSAISFRQTGKLFPPNTWALRSIDLEVGQNERLVVVGPSGCGKSTLLRLVAGLEGSTEGSIFIGGKDATNLSPKHRDTGMVFQNYALFPHLSAFDNMAYGLTVRRESAPDIRKRVQTIAEKLEIADLLSRKPHQLSGGQRQRVALGRLLSRDPSIHLFDEPLGNLDPQFRLGMRQELARLHRENPRTSIYVTHDQEEAMTLGQRICVLKKGEILQVGTPEEIYEFPSHRFTAEFFGAPGANTLHGRIQNSNSEDLHFTTGSITFPLKGTLLPPGSITLCIRPENWTIIDPENAPLLGLVKRAENLGDHRLIEVGLNEHIIYIKTNLSGICENEKLGIEPQLEKLHWFERYTGKRVVVP